MSYNTSFMNNATNVLDLSIGLGSAMGNSFLIGNLLLFSFAMIFLVLSLKEDFVNVLIIDMFITTIIGILLFMIGMVGFVSPLLPFLILVITLIMKLVTQD